MYVFNYHVLDSSLNNNYTSHVTVHEFNKIVSFLKKENYKCITSDELLICKQQGVNIYEEKVVMFTFDDCHESSLTHGFHILKEHGYNSCFGVVTDWINHNHPTRNFKFLTWEQLKFLQNNDAELFNHSDVHCMRERFSNIRFTHTKESFIEDLIKAKDRCDKNNVKLKDIFIHPFGVFNSQTSSWLDSENIHISFTTRNKHIPYRVQLQSSLKTMHNVPRLSDLTFEELKCVIDQDV